jgi:hypothetical protein
MWITSAEGGTVRSRDIPVVADFCAAFTCGPKRHRPNRAAPEALAKRRTRQLAGRSLSPTQNRRAHFVTAAWLADRNCRDITS